MKLLFLLNIGFDRPGPSVHLLRSVIKAALDRRHEVHVILMDSHGDLPQFSEEFLNNECFHYDCIEEPAGKKSGFIVRYLREIQYAFKCKKIFMNKGGYDAVFLQSCNTAIFYLWVLRTLRCPVVFNVQDIFPYNLKLSGQLPLEKLSFPIFRKLQNMAYQKAARVVTISDDMKRTLVNDGVAEEKIDVIYNWSYSDAPISVDTIAPENQKELMIGNGKFNVVYAGNIGKMQNVEILVKAAQSSAQDPDIRYYIIGDGANKPAIEEMAKDLENVNLLPMQPSRYAESIYAQASVNIIPMAKGGIFTALPSKTATCLRTGVPIIFCIDEDSEFSKLASKYENVQTAKCDDPGSLLEKIEYFKGRSGQCVYSNYDFFQKYFSVDNAVRYVEVLERLQKK